MAEKRDYYEELEVTKESTVEEIKKAYRKKAIQYHPDKNPGDKEAEEKFKEAAKASETTTESAAAMAAKNITEHRENVVHRHSAAKSAERSTVSGCSAHSCMTKLVVAGTFIRVAQYVVGFG